MTELNDDDTPDLGSCCNCGTTEGVRNIMMVDQRGPKPGTGWGCLICGLPADGAVAVLCDACVGKPVKFVCDGYATDKKRISIEQLSAEKFRHDPNVAH